jgi:hypothetical protein
MSTLSQFRQGSWVFRGMYAGGSTYRPNNVVVYNGIVYLCILLSTGNLPTNTTYFSQLTAAQNVAVANSGSGTTPASFNLTSSGGTITLNKPS